VVGTVSRTTFFDRLVLVLPCNLDSIGGQRDVEAKLMIADSHRHQHAPNVGLLLGDVAHAHVLAALPALLIMECIVQKN